MYECIFRTTSVVEGPIAGVVHQTIFGDIRLPVRMEISCSPHIQKSLYESQIRRLTEEEEANRAMILSPY
jgi:hypothetical protein